MFQLFPPIIDLFLFISGHRDNRKYWVWLITFKYNKAQVWLIMFLLTIIILMSATNSLATILRIIGAEIACWFFALITKPTCRFTFTNHTILLAGCLLTWIDFWLITRAWGPSPLLLWRGFLRFWIFFIHLSLLFVHSSLPNVPDVGNWWG